MRDPCACRQVVVERDPEDIRKDIERLELIRKKRYVYWLATHLTSLRTSIFATGTVRGQVLPDRKHPRRGATGDAQLTLLHKTQALLLCEPTACFSQDSWH